MKYSIYFLISKKETKFYWKSSFVTLFVLLLFNACSPKVAPSINVSESDVVGTPLVVIPTLVEIHHVNVNDGDATIIRIKFSDNTEKKILLDGGKPQPGNFLVPYINSVFPNSKFDYIILSHYHNDHYNGLFAIGDGSITGDYYIDLGGYSMRGYTKDAYLKLIQPKDTICPWTDRDGIFDSSTFESFLEGLGSAVNKNRITRYAAMSKPTDEISDLINVIIPLGTYTNSGVTYPIQLRCVGAWGFTLGAGGVAVDNWNKGASKNDPTLAFVLECGAFRYFLGGDMGGQASGSYIDQETTLIQGFQAIYTGSKTYFPKGADPTTNGHICGFKANHHGSAHSNNAAFLGGMKPAVCITSVGDFTSWHLPSIDFLNRLNATTSLTDSIVLPFNTRQGFFFTNLYNFPTKGVYPRTKGNTLFDTRANTAYDYNGKTIPIKGFVVRVAINDDLATKSLFTVSRVLSDYSFPLPGALLHCHSQ
ncbi:MAG: hypothetical protein DHS20C18_12980 [Saprospiraceae bacterium]|nr:MAG: hypothetical protein DHS20C18_12980 [Saprospiraceae bacterium]